MSHRRIAIRLGAVALLFSAAAIAAGSAEAKIVPGLPGEISDCVPGATNCGTGARPIKVGDRVRHHTTPPKSLRFKVGDRVRHRR